MPSMPPTNTPDYHFRRASSIRNVHPSRTGGAGRDERLLPVGLAEGPVSGADLIRGSVYEIGSGASPGLPREMIRLARARRPRSNKRLLMTLSSGSIRRCLRRFEEVVPAPRVPSALSSYRYSS